MKILESLKTIQQELRASKDLFNAFGKYKYRSAESILESVKPLLGKEKLVILLSDELVNIGNRYYVKATASITNMDGEKTEITAYAREEETKKGMDGSQITGASSSYARKYALGGLFALDDNKDSDTTNTHDKEEKKTDDSIINKIKECKTVKDLESLWSMLGEDEQPIYLDKFTTRKTILKANEGVKK
jgi:hypothetical protein